MGNTTSDKESRRLLHELQTLLRDFEQELERASLREKVQRLVPARAKLAKLGISLVPAGTTISARERLLRYFLKYPLTLIPREELMVVAGIDEWARRVRELRVEHGWSIVTGDTAREMSREGEELPLKAAELEKAGAFDYVMVSTEQDKEAAYRWNTAKQIRNQGTSVRDKLLLYLRTHAGTRVTGEELRYVAKGSTEWARRVRELRTEYGWPIATRFSGRPDLPVGMYVLEEDRQSPEHDRAIPDAVRRAVLRRDNYHCRRCDWNHALWNPSDARHLELHHVQAHAAGGENTEGNLITLCTVCHDGWHADVGDWAATEGFGNWLET